MAGIGNINAWMAANPGKGWADYHAASQANQQAYLQASGVAANSGIAQNNPFREGYNARTGLLSQLDIDPERLSPEQRARWADSWDKEGGDAGSWRNELRAEQTKQTHENLQNMWDEQHTAGYQAPQMFRTRYSQRAGLSLEQQLADRAAGYRAPQTRGVAGMKERGEDWLSWNPAGQTSPAATAPAAAPTAGAHPAATGFAGVNRMPATGARPVANVASGFQPPTGAGKSPMGFAGIRPMGPQMGSQTRGIRSRMGAAAQGPRL